MIRKKYSTDAIASAQVQRFGPYAYKSTCLWSYPLSGISQFVDDLSGIQVAPKKVMPPRVKRVKHDPLGNIEKPKKKIRRKFGSRLQPFKMNPVVIHKFESQCDVDVISIPDNYWGALKVTGAIGPTDYGVKLLANPNNFPWNHDLATEQKAIINCLAKLSSPKVLDAGVGLVEIRATLEFLKSPLKSLVKLFAKHQSSTFQRLNKVKVSRRATAREFVDAATDTWLSYRYAFKPLASDITGIMIEATEQLDTNSKILRRVSGRAKYLTNEPIRDVNSTGWCGNDFFYIDGIVRDSTVQTVTAVQLYEYRPYFNDAIKLASLGLSPTQLVSLGWELIPFSFVADWGVNVGDWLRAWEPKPWIKYHDSCVSCKHERVITITGGHCGSYTTRYPISDTFAKATQLNRTVKTLTLPRTPLISTDVLNLSRSLDSLSLAWKPISGWLQNFKTKGK